MRFRMKVALPVAVTCLSLLSACGTKAGSLAPTENMISQGSGEGGSSSFEVGWGRTMASNFSSGGDSSGGGAAVVCRDGANRIVSAELYDLYEAKVRLGLKIDVSEQDPRTQLSAVIAKIKGHDFEKAKMREMAADVLERFEFLPSGVIMAPPSDLGPGHGVVIPDGCELSAVGYYEADGKLKVSHPIYAVLSPTDRAAFILHEALYKVARDISRQSNSDISRRLNASLFAANAQASDVDSLLKANFQWGLGQPNSDLAVVSENSGGSFRIQIRAEDNEPYGVAVGCQDLAGNDIDDSVDFTGTGSKTLVLNDLPCQRVRFFLRGEKDLTRLIVMETSGGVAIYRGPLQYLKQVDWGGKVLYLTRRVELPSFPIL